MAATFKTKQEKLREEQAKQERAKKKKKNPYRLSSDRQPGIKKANKGKKKKSIKDLLQKIGPTPKTGPKRKMPDRNFKLKPGQKIYDQNGNLVKQKIFDKNGNLLN